MTQPRRPRPQLRPIAIPGGSQSPKPRTRAWPWIVGGAAAATVVIAATAVLLFDRTTTFTGSLTLQEAFGAGSKMSTGLYPCVGSRGYNDIQPGASVTIHDDTGRIIAVGRLDEGKAVGTSCVFPFTVSDVPAGSPFYEVEVSHRGGVVFSREDLAERGAQLTLGS